MAKPFIPSIHPVHRLPTAAEAVSMGDMAYREFLLKRERVIAAEKADPLHNFWEPPIWWLCDCLLGFPWVDATEAEAVRRKLGFPVPLRQLTLLGGNRSSKTQYCITRTTRLMFAKPGSFFWFWHETIRMSIKFHQRVFYDYLPPGLKGKDIKGKDGWIAFNRKNGFTENAFILPSDEEGRPGSEIEFKTYGEPSIEGASLDGCVLDELTGREASHVEVATTIPFRTADRNGFILKPFTPVNGYSETVRMDLDGAQTKLESVAYLCPKDGGDPLLRHALGLADDSALQELAKAELEKRAAFTPESYPENFKAWLRDEPKQLPAPKGRQFETVPRVMKCIDPEQKKGAVFFHSGDNPYGRPRHVYARAVGISSNPDFIKERIYGVAKKLVQARFKFDRDIHVVRAADIPPANQCTNYHLGDPHSKRNMAMGWFSVTPEHVYVRREWPGDYLIPGVGHPGLWALPGPKPDGIAGPAQTPFGWGCRHYKREIARLEGWKDYRAEKPVDMSEEEWKHAVDRWDETNGTREPIEERELDARFASTPRMEKDRPVTLITDFEEVGMTFHGMPGDDIETGLTKIDDALAFDAQRPVDFWNKPTLQISDACVNFIYALETWTGLTKEGKTDRDGATKEWIDLLKGFFLRERPFRGSSATTGDFEEVEKGQHY